MRNQCGVGLGAGRGRAMGREHSLGGGRGVCWSFVPADSHCTCILTIIQQPELKVRNGSISEVCSVCAVLCCAVPLGAEAAEG